MSNLSLEKNASYNLNPIQNSNSNIKIKNQHQTINATGGGMGVVHRKSGSCADFNQEKVGSGSINVLTGQIVENDKPNMNTIEENFNKINEINDEQNFNQFISEFDNEDEKNNLLYLAASSKVVKYYDYTSKFGLVYLITSENNYIGVCFNDFSTIIQNTSLAVMDSKSKLIYNYFDKDHKNIMNFDEIGLDSFIKSKTQNKEMSKKCEIMKQIVIKYSQEISELKPLFERNDVNDLPKVVILKDFLKVQQAMLLRLSNKLIQIIFADQTEILMSTESTDFIYRNKHGEEIFDSIQNVMNSDSTEIIKRIKFSKNLMVHFIKTYKNGTGNSLKKK